MSLRGKIYLQDIFLPLAVLMLVGIIIFPLPIFLLDIFLLFSLIFSLILLISSLSIGQPEKFTALPSLLLISTLFRLSLNIASTRQILTYAKAPELISAFGEFVVGGNVAVGVVVFLMISLVQFIVVAKGAERVAEVAARFSLDAMPGRQMSIDADVRAGVVSLSDAKKLRKDLQKESKLYGSLDGAMKFVKGDAIAGFIIALVNIIAGFIIGVMQLKLSILQALETYTIFTIGDALISQIPALLTAVAAGIVVTRVSDEQEAPLNRDISQQLFAKSEVPLLAALVLLLLSFAPGFPFWLILSLCSGLVILSVKTAKQSKNIVNDINLVKFEPKFQNIISIRFSDHIAQAVACDPNFYQTITNLKAEIYDSFGLVLNDFEYLNSSALDENKIEFYLYGALIEEYYIQEKTPVSLEVARELKSVIHKYKSEIITDTQTRIILDLNQANAEDLINSLIPKNLSVTALTRIFKELLKEHISIKNVSLILQALSESLLTKSGDKINQEVFLISEVRRALRRNITSTLISKDKEISAWILDQELDHLLANICLSNTVLHPKLNNTLKNILLEIENKDKKVVVLTSKFARSVLSSISLAARSSLNILAYDELLPEIKIKTLGTISINQIEDLNLEQKVQHAIA